MTVASTTFWRRVESGTAPDSAECRSRLGDSEPARPEITHFTSEIIGSEGVVDETLSFGQAVPPFAVLLFIDLPERDQFEVRTVSKRSQCIVRRSVLVVATRDDGETGTSLVFRRLCEVADGDDNMINSCWHESSIVYAHIGNRENGVVGPELGFESMFHGSLKRPHSQSRGNRNRYAGFPSGVGTGTSVGHPVAGDLKSTMTFIESPRERFLG
jgi:hypothetical protein